jgi:hypothetical protein
MLTRIRVSGRSQKASGLPCSRERAGREARRWRRSDDGTKEYVSRFPFAIGETANKNFYIALVLGAAGLVGFGPYYKHADQHRQQQFDKAFAPVFRRGDQAGDFEHLLPEILT